MELKIKLKTESEMLECVPLIRRRTAWDDECIRPIRDYDDFEEALSTFASAMYHAGRDYAHVQLGLEDDESHNYLANIMPYDIYEASYENNKLQYALDYEKILEGALSDPKRLKKAADAIRDILVEGAD